MLRISFCIYGLRRHANDFRGKKIAFPVWMGNSRYERHEEFTLRAWYRQFSISRLAADIRDQSANINRDY